MTQVARGLDDADIAALAEYFAQAPDVDAIRATDAPRKR